MARFHLERGPIPLHHQVFRDLKAALDSGEWVPGDRMPPERELAERYGCSLITVRHALGELVRDGRIERTRGRGTFVLPPRIERDIAGTMSFAEEMRRRGLDSATRVVTARIEPAGETVARCSRSREDAPVVYLERVRLGGGEPLILEQARLPAERFPGLLAFDLERRSLYDLLAERYRNPDRAGPRDGRAGHAPTPRGRAARAADAIAGAPDRRRRARDRWLRGRGRAKLRSGRSDALLPRA